MGDSKKWQFVLTQVGSCFEKKPHYLRNNQMLPKTKSSLECSVVVLCCSTHISSYIDSANLNVALYMMKFKTVVIDIELTFPFGLQGIWEHCGLE